MRLSSRTQIRYDVLGLGCTAVDDLLYVPEFPAPDAKIAVVKRERHCGGLTATALVAAARLGARCAYAGTLGEDAESEFVLQTLQREGVDIRHARRRAGVRPVRSVVLVEQKRRTRTILYDTRAAGGAEAGHPPRAVIEQSRVLLVDRFGFPGMLRAARVAQAAGRAVLGDFESAQVRFLSSLLALVNHLIVPLSFALAYTDREDPHEALKRLHAWPREATVATLGAEGFLYLSGEESELHKQTAFRVRAVDTTGCGDVFHGAYAAALAQGLGLEARLQMAAAAAALKATRAGGQTGIPSMRELRQFLASAGCEPDRARRKGT
jgi:sugar/nucleoside kinase (ribokinase family)